MKTLNGHDADESTAVETYWVVDVFGQNDKVKRKSRRPPTYNSEDYVVFLRQLIASNNTSASLADRLYGQNEALQNQQNQHNNGEMRVKPPLNLSDVLRKLRQDLTFSFVSFSKEFASEACDGVSLLLDILRAIQMVQADLSGLNKDKPALRLQGRTKLRQTYTDELEVLLCLNQLCLANGCVPGKDYGCSRLLEHRPGFYGLALSLVSSQTKTRSVSLQLMTAICKMDKGHSRVSEALTTLRLNMGEPVRLKLLTGIINSAASRVESLAESNKFSESSESSLRFLVEAVAFLNAFVQSAPDLRHQIVIQWEVEEAGLNIQALCQVCETNRSPLAVQLKQELALWAENQVDLPLLIDRLTNVTSTNDALRKDLQNLRFRLVDLESEKTRFAELEQGMKQRCDELEKQLQELRSLEGSQNAPVEATKLIINVGAPEQQYQETSSESVSNDDDDDEEIDIDDVIEELNNIVSSAESDLNYQSKMNSMADGGGGVYFANQSDRYDDDWRPDGRSSAPSSVGDRRSKPSADKKAMSKTFFGQPSPVQDTVSMSYDEYDENNSMVVSSISRQPSSVSLYKNIALSSGSSRPTDDERSIDEDVNDAVESEVEEDTIQPDILRTIPSRLFYKSWNVVEARSPLYIHDYIAGDDSDDVVLVSRTRFNSMEHLRRTENNEIGEKVIAPTIQSSAYDVNYLAEGYESPVYLQPQSREEHMMDVPLSAINPPDIDRVVSLGDLQVGDVFSFEYANTNKKDSAASKARSKSSKYFHLDLDAKSPRHTFAFSDLLPGFLKSSFHNRGSTSSSSKVNRSEASVGVSRGETDEAWLALSTEKALMKDYRQHFQRSPIPANRSGQNEAQFWPSSFQALPFRSIPQLNKPTTSADPTRLAPSQSPTVIAHSVHTQVSHRTNKLMDHPSGLY